MGTIEGPVFCALSEWQFHLRANPVVTMRTADGGIYDVASGTCLWTMCPSKFWYLVVDSEDDNDNFIKAQKPELFWIPKKQELTLNEPECGHGPYHNASLPIGWLEYRTHCYRRYYVTNDKKTRQWEMPSQPSTMQAPTAGGAPTEMMHQMHSAAKTNYATMQPGPTFGW